MAETGKDRVTMRWFARCLVSHWSDVQNWARIWRWWSWSRWWSWPPWWSWSRSWSWWWSWSPLWLFYWNWSKLCDGNFFIFIWYIFGCTNWRWYWYGYWCWCSYCCHVLLMRMIYVYPSWCSILHQVTEYIDLPLIKSLPQTWESPPVSWQFSYLKEHLQHFLKIRGVDEWISLKGRINLSCREIEFILGNIQITTGTGYVGNNQ